MIWLVILIALLLTVALAAWGVSRLELKRSGLPRGRLLYSDTGFALGRMGGITLNDEGERQEKALASRRYGLTGRPDYLIETRDGIVPVEVKSAMSPADGVPYDSHVMQLAAYCLLVEDVLKARVPYGLVRYRDREARVAYTPELREELLDLLEEMRAERDAEEVHRSHMEPRRCAGCSMNEVCDEALSR